MKRMNEEQGAKVVERCVADIGESMDRTTAYIQELIARLKAKE